MKGEASFVELLLHLVNGAGDASACQRGQFQKKKKSQQAIGLMFFFFFLAWKSLQGFTFCPTSHHIYLDLCVSATCRITGLSITIM